MLFPYNLHWDDLDPARHPFDPDAAQATVESLAPHPGFPSHPDCTWARWRSAEESGALIDGAIGGRFESWAAPGPDVVGEVAGRLAAGLVHRDDD